MIRLSLQKQKLAETLPSVEAPSIVAQQPAMLVDYLSSMQAKTFSKMSGIELADIQIPGAYSVSSRPRESLIQKQTESSIVDTTLWNGSRNLDQLVDFITKSEHSNEEIWITRYRVHSIAAVVLVHGPQHVV